ncbi:hypothetical protein WSK_2279 [Novosphingobium sp. Rr 2-17]|uniref:L-histidine N(alpha)-methyltransferase n=1 Tax=Novosphingobium sp. Rr 2-17 TaxID=555793 RepID=UPI0002699BBA|nr:L-histidine N(alpha)-methyltransferase [Novosphingobium sp. Rr 2-17]EIZ79092.1 hypothetical protein WSK_2279 [Novosphingobium sp. Rr 2-17]
MAYVTVEATRGLGTELGPELGTDSSGEFCRTVLEGLSQSRKILAARFFYDDAGSALFEQITTLPEYYPTRIETALLTRHAEEIAALAGPGRPLVEFGAGSATKTPLLLRATGAKRYIPVDISGDFLEEAMVPLRALLPHLKIEPIAGDFTQPLALPVLGEACSGFFPGSTIGNFDHRGAVDLLRAFRRMLGDDATLVIGVDTRKDRATLEAAYDDAAGVTAAFNRNILVRINRELGGTIPIEDFDHRAVWNEVLGRVEMHLVARRSLTFRVAGRSFAMQAGETIHTENSHKYTPEEVRLLARAAGWEPLGFWTDDAAMFGVHVWTATGAAMQP